MILGLLACSGDSDPRLYLAAVDAEPTEAAALCARIGDAGTRDSCLAFTAQRVATTDRDAAARWCDRVSDGAWRDECRFLVVDEAGLLGDEAVAWCGRLERYRGECTASVLSRAVRAAELPADEQALVAAVSALVDAYEGHAPDEHRLTTARRIAAKLVSERMDGAFDAGACRDPDLCALAYRMRALPAMPAASIEAVCTGPLTPDAVLAAGAPPWTAGSEPVVMAAWRDSCDEVARRQAWRRGDRSVKPPPPLVDPLR